MVKLTMEPVTRIEGHAKITVQLDDDGNVVDTRLHVMEFRGFEKFLQGRPVEELARIVPRICGICDERNYELGFIYALPRTSFLLLSCS